MKIEYRKRSGIVFGFLLFFLTLHFVLGQTPSDSDGDGIADTADLDDDNDGIVDAMESPGCFYTAGDFEAGNRSSFVTVTSGLSMNATYNTPQKLVDGDVGTTTSSYAVNFNATPTQSNVGKNIYTFQFEAPVELTKIYLQYINGNSHFNNGAVVKLQGSYDGSTWVDLNTGATYNQANTNGIVLNQGTMRYQVFSVTQNSDQYLYYQIRGVSGTISSAGTSNEVYFQVQSAGFNASLYPKGTCTADTDGDSILNHQDLDSDGDGCSDLVEANVSPTTDVVDAGAQNNEGGSWGISDPTNAQLNPGGSDANNDGLNDSVDAAQDGQTDYTSTYSHYVVDDKLNYCLDFDGDGIPDLDDIDDDNDGILDTVEQKLVCETEICNSWVAPPAGAPTKTAPATIMVGGEEITYTITTSGNPITLQASDSWTDLQCGLGTLTGIPNWQRADQIEKVTFNFSQPVSGLAFVLSAIENTPESVKITTNNTVRNQIICQSCTEAKIVSINSQTSQVYGAGSNAEIFKIIGPTYTSVSIEVTDVGGAFLLTYGLCALETTEIFKYADLNIDSDTSPNHQDLDSDGDGCSDSYEAGAITSETPNHQYNTSGSGDANGDGLADVVDNGTNGGTASDGMPDYLYTPYAYSATLNLCTDTDNDGKGNITDIDDDNDGILDATESPSCFYTEAEATKIASISTDISPYNNHYITYAIDGDPSTYSALAPDVGAVGDVLFRVTPQAPIRLEKMEYDPISWGITNSTDRAKLQGYNGANWEDLTGALVLTATSGTVSIDNTLHPNSVYSEFRLIISAASNYYAGIKEIRLVAHNYHASLNPKASCTTDTDGDGILNHQDLDSDGDGCSDSYEAGAIASETPNHQYNTSGSGDANGDGLADVVDNGTNGGTASDGMPDYTYTPYAYSSTLNLCTDTDNDGKSNITDIDDDNDGILDATESPSCFYTEAEATKIASISTDIPPYNNHYITYAIDGDPSTYSALAPDVGAVGDVLFRVTPQAPIRLGKMEYDPISWGITNSTDRAKLQGYNGANWEDLTGALVLTATSGTVSIDNTLHPNSVYREFRLIISVASNYYAGIKEIRLVAHNYHASLNPKASCTTDTDGDGILNHQDLDSDGDGCSDSYEAGAIASETPNHQYNTSGSGDANGDGLADVVDNGTNGGTASDGMPDYIYTPYAYSSTLNLCTDTDNDGKGNITDIDDDNDGILDATESPSCFYTEAEATKITSISTDIPPYNNHYITYAIDGDPSTYSALAPDVGAVGNVLFRVTPQAPIRLDKMEYDPISWGITNSTDRAKLQGYDGANWEDLTGGLELTATSGTVSIDNTLHPNSVYSEFRLIISVASNYYAGIKEIRLVAHNYNVSLNPKASCTTDTDGDGILNHQDLDSDGDGCSDSYEAGAIASETPNHQYNTSGSGDANGDGLADVVDNGSNGGTASDGMPDYTYTPYAYSSTLNLCTDTDNDGKGNITDIDDDNDGILDATESPSCFYTEAEATKITSISTDIPPYNNHYITYAIDGDPSTYSAFVADVGAVGDVLFRVTPQAPIRLDKMEYDPISWGITNSTGRAKLQGYNGANWEDLTGALVLTATSGTVSIDNTLHPNSVYSEFRLIISAASNYYAGIKEIRLVAHNYIVSLNPKASCTTDTDGDGILNHQDLDSDGDGCSDSYEAGAIASETPNHQYNTSGSGDANGDGLADVVDNGSNGGTASDGMPDYTYTPYAYSSTLNLCTDTDNDGKGNITDIDDDNDGILDATESPSCFYTEAEATKITSISTDIPPYNNHYITYAIDGDPSTYSALAPDVGNVGNVLFRVTPQAPIRLGKMEYDPISWGITNSTDRAKLQGYNGANWEDLTGALVLTATSGTVSIDNTLHPNSVYSEFRLIISAASNYYAGIKEIRLVAQNYNSSLHPKAACTTDTDGDGIVNHQDLDSDGDGCTDAEEAGTHNKAGVVMQPGEVKNGSGGFVSSQESNPNAVVGGPYGGNGFADVLQKASPDTNQYKYTYTYSKALDSTDHACCPVISNNTIGSNQGVCPPDTASTLTGSVPTLRPTGDTVLYQWMSSTSSATSGFSNVPGRTSKDFTFSGPLTQTTHYKRVAHTASCSKYNDTTAAVTVTVKSLPTITDEVTPTCLDKQKYLTVFETSGQANSAVTVLPVGLMVNRGPRDTTTIGGDESWYLEVPSGTDFTVTVTEDGCSVEKSYTAPDTCGGNTPYALGLEGFSAERVEGDIRLSWRVAEPELLDRAVLERGGVPTGLESIGVFLDSTGDGYYSYMDRDPIVGENFYRLSLYGAGGTVEASEGLRVAYDPLDKYAYLLQNPVEGGMAVLRTNTDAPVVSVYDLSGRAVPFSQRQLGGDLHLFFGGMPDRVLIVRLRAGQLLRSFRVVLR